MALASLVLLLAFVTGGALASPAAAHGPNGLFQVQRSSVVAPLTVAFRVRLIYTNDTEPVTEGATVTMQGSGPGGSVGPVPMSYAGTDGFYTATVVFPAGGTWAITFRSVNPAAQYAHTEVVPSPAPPPTEPPPTAVPAPTAAPSTTDEPSSPSSTEVPVTEPTTTIAPAPSTTALEADMQAVEATPASASKDAGYDLAVVLLGALTAAAVLSATTVIAWRRGPR